MTQRGGRPYEANPCYPPSGGRVAHGWDDLAATVRSGRCIVAVDGPAIANWDHLVQSLTAAMHRRARAAEFISTSRWTLAWERLKDATSSAELGDDPDFERLPSGDLGELVRAPGRLDVPEGTVLFVYGPGASLVPHDALWYADLPKRYAEAAVTAHGGLNLGQPQGTGPATTKRLFFVDWPLLDRHRDGLVGVLDQWVDMQSPHDPAFIDGATLRATLAQLSHRPFRTRPTFNTTPWGGHWAQEQLGHRPGAVNTALGYELIAPEAGVLVGLAGEPRVELPFQLLVASFPGPVLGSRAHTTFGSSFPIRFDYLDTVGGGNLSVHCHPREDYMRDVFGWPYTQHESYYVMVGSEDQDIFLGLREDADVGEFRERAHEAHGTGAPMEVTDYVSVLPATQHQLFLIPGGTPHGSGQGNVVLEVSATPYLYSLRFYDWLRRDSSGGLRPVHVDHAFKNLDTSRRGAAVQRDLVQAPRVDRQGAGWHEEVLGRLPEMFFEVRRLVLLPGAVAACDATSSFHVLNVVEGEGVIVEPFEDEPQSLMYAETMVVPAAVGRYRVRNVGLGRTRVVKALVP